MNKSIQKITMIICSTAIITAVVLSIIIPLIFKAATVTAPGKLYPIYRVDTDEKVVALGINCAWEDDDTDEFLRVLKEKNVRATFFVTGEFVQRCENAVLRISNAGHEVGNHSDSHPDMQKLGKEEIVREITSAERKIQKVTGIKPTLFRAPSGSYNTTLIQTANELGYHAVQWDCDTIDWKGYTADVMLEKVMKKLQNGSILLLHLGAEHTAEALGKMIDEIQNKGYDILPVGELIYTENYYVDRQGVQKRQES